MRPQGRPKGEYRSAQHGGYLMSDDNKTFALRRRLLQVLGTTAALWGLGARAQQQQPLQQLRIGYQTKPVRAADMV